MVNQRWTGCHRVRGNHARAGYLLHDQCAGRDELSSMVRPGLPVSGYAVL